MPDIVSEVSHVDESLLAPGVQDLLVKTDDPAALDNAVYPFGAAVMSNTSCTLGIVGGYAKVDGAYLVRCWSKVDFIRHIIETQGCGEVVGMCSGRYDEKEKLPQWRAPNAEMKLAKG